jgi:hypothetical protein
MMVPNMAFAVREHEPPAIEVRINFGVFAGRDATYTEIDRLAQWLLDEAGDVTIVSEKRHEFDAQVEASVHQVRIEVTNGVPADDLGRRALERRILERAEYWARQCVAERHIDVAEL